MEIDPTTLPYQSVYKIMTGSVLPRPIGWISSIDLSGRPNLAPFSFFNLVCSNPPTVLFCPTVRSTDGKPKDTLNNVRATGEFVINIFGEDLAQKMNASSVEAPPELNEFEFAELETAPSLTVRPPRVRLAPIHFECRLNQIIEINPNPGGGAIVIGTIVRIHIDERVLEGADKINLAALRPIGRLAGNYYTRVTDLFEMVRPEPQIRSTGNA
jgi:flavin reductase (DIM6/NTAB) family NADH-FMN oxidoreductase RutF